MLGILEMMFFRLFFAVTFSRNPSLRALNDGRCLIASKYTRRVKKIAANDHLSKNLKD
jgi:hypothetical protein